LGLIAIVLLQKGKGVGFAGAFGVGAGSEAVFGPQASRSLPVRLTRIMVVLFMVLALGMSLIAGKAGKAVAPDIVNPVEVSPTLGGLEDLGIGTALDDPSPAPADGASGDLSPVLTTDETPEDAAGDSSASGEGAAN
jgi:protein translocase SecG subunit